MPSFRHGLLFTSLLENKLISCENALLTVIVAFFITISLTGLLSFVNATLVNIKVLSQLFNPGCPLELLSHANKVLLAE